GTVVAVMAVPRAVFMLVGGAVTDAYSPRVVLLASNCVRMGLVLCLAVFTWDETITVWMIYAIAVVFGLADAFMFPASSAFPPRLLPPERLAAGNGLSQGTAQLTLVLGPLLAGVLIAGFGTEREPGIEDSAGLALVFALDSLTFLLPIGILFLIRDRFPPAARAPENMWQSLLEGLRYAWQDVPIRTFTLLLGGFGLFFRGPFAVGIPAFADAFLPEGARAFGIIISALGVGAIIGTVLAGTTRHPAPSRFGLLILADFLGFGVIFLLMTQHPDTWFIASTVLAASVLDGYLTVLMVTWFQQRVPAEKLGRVMSVIMTASQGLFPISAAVAGVLAEWNLTLMLLGAGCVMVSVTLSCLFSQTVRRMGHA
ncbi:MAG: MFS transporter, partial [Gammaproteobacteria bacterium]